MTRNRNILKNPKSLSDSVVTANGNIMQIIGTGSCDLKPSCTNDGDSLQNVQLLPDLSVNLLSVSRQERSHSHFQKRRLQSHESEG